MRRHWRYKAGQNKCGLEAKEIDEKLHLGRFVHEVLDLFVTKGTMPATAGLEYARREQRPEVLPYEAASAVLAGYASHYPLEPKLKVILHEHPFLFSDINEQHVGAEVVGRLDLLYEDTDGLLVLRENKYWSKRATIPEFQTIQTTIYCAAVLKLTGMWPSFVEWNILRQPDDRGKTKDGWLEKVVKDATFERRLVPVCPEEILSSWKWQVQGKILSMDGLIPSMNTWNCMAYSRPCEYMPLCRERLAGREPMEEHFAKYEHKETKHPELK
jgi:hypothetical protein